MVLLGLFLMQRSDKRKYLTAAKSFTTTNGGGLKTKDLIRYYSNFVIDFYFKTSEPDVVLVSQNTDPIIVVKLTDGVLVLGVLAVPGVEQATPLPITFAPTKFIRSTLTLNDNDWHYVRLFYNESINRLLCKADNNPTVAVPLAKPTWSKVRISLGKVDHPKYTSPPFKGCFQDLGYKDNLRSVRFTETDMIVSTYKVQVC